MEIGFASAAKRGQHYELVNLALKKLKFIDLMLKGQKERRFEHSVVSYLQSTRKLRKNLITQISEDEVNKIKSVKLFGFSHRPDVSIGIDGTAIEIKVVSTGSSIRDILGQALAYRMDYRFVILVLIDQSTGYGVVESCKNKKTSEYKLLSWLANKMNIFSVVGPLAPSKNLVFKSSNISRGTDIPDEKQEESEEQNEEQEENNNAVENEETISDDASESESETGKSDTAA